MPNPVSQYFKSLRRSLFGEPAPKVAVLRLYGVIGAGGRFKQNLSLAALASQIEQAFTMGGLSAVAIMINSPGGSPVQSELIMKRIRAMAEEKDVPVLAFAEDVAASGGYMLALAGDEIYVNEASIIGSIGVISSGFGFKEAIGKLGIKRRLYTAGESKSMLDPFEDEKEEDITRLKEIQHEIHEHFKALVRGRRGKRLKGLRGKIFSGDVFTGLEAVKLGLVDGIGDARSVLKDRFGKKVKLKVIEEKKSRLGSLLSFGARSSMPQSLVDDLPLSLIHI